MATKNLQLIGGGVITLIIGIIIGSFVFRVAQQPEARAYWKNNS